MLLILLLLLLLFKIMIIMVSNIKVFFSIPFSASHSQSQCVLQACSVFEVLLWLPRALLSENKLRWETKVYPVSVPFS